jgi:hypothetical protein
LVFQQHAVSHELPHQNVLNDTSCPLNSHLIIHTLNDQQILNWFEMDVDYTDIDLPLVLADSAVMIEKDPEPYLEKSVAKEIAIESESALKTSVVCSIYDKPFDSINTLCGEVDHFMKAAQGAINYCYLNYGLDPYFLGPQNFIDAINQESMGAHHDNYSLEEGIRFTCVRQCPKEHAPRRIN